MTLAAITIRNLTMTMTQLMVWAALMSVICALAAVAMSQDE